MKIDVFLVKITVPLMKINVFLVKITVPLMKIDDFLMRFVLGRIDEFDAAPGAVKALRCPLHSPKTRGQFSLMRMGNMFIWYI